MADYNSTEPTYKKQSFFIAAMCTPPQAGAYGNEDDFITLEHYQNIADSGIEYVFPTYDQYRPDLHTITDQEPALRALEYCLQTGIKYFITDGGLAGSFPENASYYDKVREYVDPIANHPAVAGHNVYDEPGVPGSPDTRSLEEIYEHLCKIKEIYDKEYPHLLFYINHLSRQCFPGENYWTDWQIATPSYYEEYYIKGYVNKAKPSMISFDHYPFLTEINNKDFVLTETDRSHGSKFFVGFLENLETFAHVSQEYHLPYYAYVQTIEHWAGDIRHIRYMFPEDFRYQINIMLAFGCTGFQYFTYWCPHDDKNFSYGLCDYAGKKTEHFDVVKQINLELRSFQDVFLHYQWKAVMPVLADSTKQNPDFSLLRYSVTYYERIDRVETTEDTIIGIFSDSEGNEAFMVTNATDPFNQKTAHIALQLNHAMKAVTYVHGIRNVVDLPNGTLEINLSAGEGLFLVPLA